jgi:hypothetical protein
MLQKNKKGVSALVITILIVAIIGILVAIYFTITYKQEIETLKKSLPCEDTDVKFDLISCEYVKSDSLYKSTVKFKRTDSSALNVQKVLALISSEGGLKFITVPTSNFYNEQESDISAYQLIPKNFYLIISLDNKNSCKTSEISCTEKIAEENVPTGNQTQTTTPASNGTTPHSNGTTSSTTPTTPVTGMDAIRNAIEAALA